MEETQEYIDPEELADGKVLLYLKSRFRDNAVRETLIPLLGYMRDSVLYVPFHPAGEGAEAVSPAPYRLMPDILKDPSGKGFLPVFSQIQQLPADYAAQFTVSPVKAMDCLALAHQTDGVSGLVLDAFTEQVTMPFEIADALEDFPSQLRPGTSDHSEG